MNRLHSPVCSRWVPEYPSIKDYMRPKSTISSLLTRVIQFVVPENRPRRSISVAIDGPTTKKGRYQEPEEPGEIDETTPSDNPRKRHTLDKINDSIQKRGRQLGHAEMIDAIGAAFGIPVFDSKTIE